MVQVFELFRRQQPSVRLAGQHLLDAVLKRLQQECVGFGANLLDRCAGVPEQVPGSRGLAESSHSECKEQVDVGRRLVEFAFIRRVLLEPTMRQRAQPLGPVADSPQPVAFALPGETQEAGQVAFRLQPFGQQSLQKSIANPGQCKHVGASLLVNPYHVSHTARTGSRWSWRSR